MSDESKTGTVVLVGLSAMVLTALVMWRLGRDSSYGAFRVFSSAEARLVGDDIGVPWESVNLDEFRRGLTVELEHGKHDPETNVSDDDLRITGKIAWAHLKELPDYYTRLARIED